MIITYRNKSILLLDSILTIFIFSILINILTISYKNIYTTNKSIENSKLINKYFDILYSIEKSINSSNTIKINSNKIITDNNIIQIKKDCIIVKSQKNIRDSIIIDNVDIYFDYTDNLIFIEVSNKVKRCIYYEK